ncbi:hypothetical protein KAH94_06340 [bacterium]|nr:hypothetical protein [bacterium]
MDTGLRVLISFLIIGIIIVVGLKVLSSLNSVLQTLSPELIPNYLTLLLSVVCIILVSVSYYLKIQDARKKKSQTDKGKIITQFAVTILFFLVGFIFINLGIILLSDLGTGMAAIAFGMVFILEGRRELEKATLS